MRLDCPSRQSEPRVVRRRRHHAALAVRAGGGDAGTSGATRIIVDETLEPLDLDHDRQPGDVVGIGIHTGNALRGYEIGRLARERGAWVVYGGIHATLFPDEAARARRARTPSSRATATSSGRRCVDDCFAGQPAARCTTAAASTASSSCRRAGICCRTTRYMWASVQTVRGCPKHCSFCSVWRTDGQEPRQRGVDAWSREIVELRRRGFRFIALADDNFYPVTLEDLAQARRRADHDARCTSSRRCAPSASS